MNVVVYIGSGRRLCASVSITNNTVDTAYRPADLSHTHLEAIQSRKLEYQENVERIVAKSIPDDDLLSAAETKSACIWLRVGTMLTSNSETMAE